MREGVLFLCGQTRDVTFFIYYRIPSIDSSTKSSITHTSNRLDVTGPRDLSASNGRLVDNWIGQPAPLLSALHAYHDRDQQISDEAVREVSDGLGIPLAELFGTVTFYHHFARKEPGKSAPRVCDGPVCRLRGSQRLLESLKEHGASPMPCAGRCDQPIPVLRDHEVLVGVDASRLDACPSPLPPVNPAGSEECVFAHVREPGRSSLNGYRVTGGYEAIEQALQADPNQVIEIITSSGLAGRGGAGFPTGQKWQAVAEADGKPKTIVCNADEGEPGCFKDRAIMDYDPHAVIEGMLLAAYATGASRGFIYLRYEYPETAAILETAIKEARGAGLVGEGVLDSGFTFELYLRRGAGAYVCGEEGSLLNSLEGKHPFPRNRPPFPVTHGFENLPTAVNNVETLVSAPPIIRKGADWYRGLGLGDHAGTKLVSLSGDIAHPGNYEVPLGLPLQTLLHEWAGGPSDSNHTIQAVTMAGLSGGFLAGEDLNVTLDEPSIRGAGSFLGAGGIMVFDDRRDMIEMAHGAMEFFAEESCGKCFPCRLGTQRLTERLSGSGIGPADPAQWRHEVIDMGLAMMSTSACGLGVAAPNITQSLLKYFPERVEEYLSNASGA